MIDRIEFLFSEAITALRRNLWMTFAAVTTAAMALYLLGGLGLAYTRLSGWLETLKKDYQIRVFLAEGITKDQRQAAREAIQKIPGVVVVRFVSKDQGLRDFAKKNPNIDVSDLAQDNPLPDVFHVTIQDLDDAPRISEQLSKMKFVESGGVKSSDDLRSFVEETVNQSRLLGMVIGGLMFITGGVLIYNAIRLTIIARRREIRIMELVGATTSTIRTPLLIEGMFHGMLGGLLAFIFLYASTSIIAQVVKNLDAMGTFEAFPAGQAMVFFLTTGAVYGWVCSWLAARSPRSEI